MKNSNLFSNYFNLDSSIKPIITSRPTKKTLFTILFPLKVNKNKKLNYSKGKRKKLFCKNIIHDLLANKENSINFSVNDESYNQINLGNLFESNNYDIYKKNLEVIEYELNMVNKRIEENKNDLDKLNKNLSELNDIKNEKKLSIENYVSKKETLNEMYQYLINDIKNKNKDNIDKNYNINITLEELYFNNKESYINKILKVFNEIYNSNNKKYYILIKNTINQAYEEMLFLKNNQSIDKNILIDNFFFKISKLISASNSDEKSIKLKLNIISDKINKIIKFLDSEYKSKSIEINNKISEKEAKINSLEIKKVELTQLKNKIIEKLKILKRIRTPFYERIKNDNIHNNNLINSISSSINFSCELFNKSKSNSKSKSKDTNKYLYKNYNNFDFCKNKTVRNSKEKLRMYLIKSLNQKNRHVKYDTNKLSNNKIFLNGISHNLNDKNVFYFTKKNNINQNRDFNENIKTERTKRKIYIKNKIKNCLTSGNKRNKIIKLMKDNTYNRFNLTESYNNSIFNNTCEIKNRINDFSNGNSKDKQFKNKLNKNISNKNNYIKTKSIKTETEKVKENTNDYNYKIRVKKILNEDLISQKKNLNLTNIYSINKNSFFKTLKSNKSKYINKWKNFLGGKNKTKSEEKKNKFELKLNKLSNINIKTLNNCFSTRENVSKPNKIINSQNSIRSNNDELKYFCYYKFLENDSRMFNPLKNVIDLKNSEYNEVLISKDISTKSVKIIPIFSNQNDKNNFIHSNKMFNNSNGLDTINIEFKKITNVYLNNLMENIIKIRNIYLKYNSNKNKQNGNEKENETLNINKFLNSREIMNIKDLSQEEKIKAGLCNFFSLIIEFNYIHKIELIIINFNQFNSWLTYLKDILDKNIKNKHAVLNGSSNISNAKN